MNATTTIKRFGQATLLCAGLGAANAVWSDCQPGAGAASARQTDAEAADAGSRSAGSQPGSPSAAELYDLFHDVELNKSDGLGDYVHNFQAPRPY